MDRDTEQLLRAAASEIRQLRQTNAILAAKVEMIDLFACVLHSHAAERTRGMGEDIAWRIDRHIEALSATASTSGAPPPATSTATADR